MTKKMIYEKNDEYIGKATKTLTVVQDSRNIVELREDIVANKDGVMSIVTLNKIRLHKKELLEIVGSLELVSNI